MRSILLFCFGFVCLSVAVPDFFKSWQMSRWPVTVGRVVSAETRQEPDGERFRYFADIFVEYTVNGEKFRTGSVRADSLLSAGDRAWSDRIVGYYQRNREVEVHYREANPAEARVEIDPQRASWVLLVWAACAWFGAWWVWKR